MISVYSDFSLDDMTVRYLLDGETGHIGLQLFPTGKKDGLVPRRSDLSEIEEIKRLSSFLPRVPRAWCVQPLVEFSLAGDPHGESLGQGMTLRKGNAVIGTRFRDLTVSRTGGDIRIVTESLNGKLGVLTRHILEHTEGSPGLTSWSEIENRGSRPFTVEMITSFNLGHISPFHPADAPGRLYVHRFRSTWSGEGRHDVRSLEELDLERSWSGHEMRCERFGMTGTKPVRRWFSFTAVEDRNAGVIWGAQLRWAGSWQFELFRQDDFLTMSGGLADRETGHWFKHIQPGESFSTPQAYVSVCSGGIDELCARLTAMQYKVAVQPPDTESELPVLFNEWCTSWGKPKQEDLTCLADTCREAGLRYLVIDAGWYAKNNGDWQTEQGDWEPSPKLFPQGLAATCKEIRSRGIIPGLWFEFEVAGPHSSLWNREDMLLKRDGIPVQAGSRRFLDFRLDTVHEYLERRVLDLIEQTGIGYLKIDYNETVGFGVDGAESQGEGLRQHVLGLYRFLGRIRERFPGLIIENCSSGGQRMEPSLIEMTDMTSFSDAHEIRAIPIIAANVQRVILPRYSQVWSVLRKEDNEKRLYYSLAATFLGRMCLSGDIHELSGTQIGIVKKAVDFYRAAGEIIKNGTSYRFGPTVERYNYPGGWQAVLRYGRDGRSLLAVIHRFENNGNNGAPLSLSLEGEGMWKVARVFSDQDTRIETRDAALEVHGLSLFSGCGIILSK